MYNVLNTIVVSSLVFVVFIVAILAVYYFMSRKNMKKQHEHFSKLHENLHVGQKVICANGIYGVVKRVGTDHVDVDVSKGMIITVSRYAISEVLE